MIERIGHAAIDVPDLNAAVTFYTDFIGLRVTETVDETTYLTCNDRHHELVLHQASGTPGLSQVGLQVAPGTLGACVERAVAAGATSPNPVTEPGVKEAVLLTAPLGIPIKLFDGMARVDGSSAAGPERFGHVNLTMPDLSAWSAFLEEGLGFELSDRASTPDGGMFIGWYHCQGPEPDHHGIAITQAPAVQLHHIKWEYPSLDPVVDIVDRYCAGDNALVWGVGRHGVDNSVFAYVLDPSGVMNEIGRGMLRLGEGSVWTGPRDWEVTDRKAINVWGSPVPEPWLMQGTPVAGRDPAAVG